MRPWLSSLTFFLCLMGCEDQKSSGEEPGKLFELLTVEQSGIDFSNDILEDEKVNGILYEYLYNGGGVAAGDFNGDDLPELFFVSNQGKNAFFLNKGGLEFEEITIEANLFETPKGFPTGVTVADVNADGLLDIYLCRSGKYNNPTQRKNLLYINKGTNKRGLPIFKEEGAKYGLDLEHYSTQSSFFDYDGDGDLDMFLINHGPQIYEERLLLDLRAREGSLQSERLYENVNGKFVDVSEQAGLINNGLSFGLGLAIGDVNNDGWPDVLVGQDFMQKDHLYLNNGDKTFKEIIKESTNHVSYFSMGNDMADFNNDGWLDFMTVDMVAESSYDIKTSMSGMNPLQFYQLVDFGFHHQYMFNCLQLNQGVTNGVPKFSDIAQLANVSNTDWSWSVLFFDADNDGLKDLFVSNGIKRDFRSNDFVKYKEKKFNEFFGKYQDNTKENKRRARLLTMDLIKKMPKKPRPNYLFKNTDGIHFERTQWFEEVSNISNGALYADLDLDGDLDLVLNNMDDEASIYKNLLSDYNYLNVKLNGGKKNPLGLGARVELTTQSGKQTLENYSTRGFQSASHMPLHFGIKESKIDEVRVLWPDGKETTLKDIGTNQLLTISYETALPTKLQKQGAWTSNSQDLPFKHSENTYDDFAREGLLPHRMSRFGPAIAVGDADGDGQDDIFAGGASGQASTLFLQTKNGEFITHQVFSEESNYEDVDAAFVDIEGDGDMDIYVVAGGNENKQGSEWLNDRLYINSGGGNFEISGVVPLRGISGGRVQTFDIDKDGDQDFFVTGRQVPGAYPSPASSYLIRNESDPSTIKLTVAHEFESIGMVTDATWLDINNDTWHDLILVGEWMAPMAFLNDTGRLEQQPIDIGLSEEAGWWFSVESLDVNNDGLEDFVAGNMGLNYKYKASKKKPFEIYYSDFDQSGDMDIVLSYTDENKKVPVRGRECSSQEMPFIKEKFASYHAFASSSMQEIYGSSNLENALSYMATNFSSTVFINTGDGTFEMRSLASEAQISNVSGIVPDDIDGDGIIDLILAGNFFVSEVETPRNDASYGCMLLGKPNGEFEPIPLVDSKLYIDGDVRNLKKISVGNKRAVLVARNNQNLKIVYY